MKVLSLFCATIVIAASMTGCNQAPPAATAPPDTHDADVKAISDDEVQANKDWAAKDADKILSHYADDAILMVPGAEAAKGRDAIKGVLSGMVADKALVLTYKATKVDVAKSGDIGVSQGDYQMTYTDPVVHKVVNDHGSYVTSYRKQADGSWKAVNDIATSAVPPAAPPKHKSS
jgi:uncharacterized protein (TIGR02246 family)